MRSYNDKRELLPEEVDTINRLAHMPLHSLSLDAIAVVTNLYRAAQGVRVKMEREVLSQHGLSWTAFSLLYDLWIWDAMETKKLAQSAGVTKATVSNITNTLERKEFCFRKVDEKDKRNVLIHITEKGKQIMAELYPLFHEKEKEIVSDLNKEEQNTIAELLRRIIRTNEF